MTRETLEQIAITQGIDSALAYGRAHKLSDSVEELAAIQREIDLAPTYNHAALIARERGLAYDEVRILEKAGKLGAALQRAEEAQLEDVALELYEKSIRLPATNLARVKASAGASYASRIGRHEKAVDFLIFGNQFTEALQYLVATPFPNKPALHARICSAAENYFQSQDAHSPISYGSFSVQAADTRNILDHAQVAGKDTSELVIDPNFDPETILSPDTARHFQQIQRLYQEGVVRLPREKIESIRRKAENFDF